MNCGATTYRAKGFEPLSRDGRLVNAMSVDVEDYFQVQALAGAISREDWEQQPRRVEVNTNRILDQFDSHGVKATFFTLGWVAERHPTLVRRIVADGHELASHGSEHRRADDQTPETFRQDIRRSKTILEDIGGVGVCGYRAPTFSIGDRNLWAFRILAEEGYAYSSSVYPMKRDYYGMPSAPRFAFYPLQGHPLEEYPITTVRLAGRNLPGGGGGFFRLLPYVLSRAAINRINRSDRQPAIFYFHPWEIDPLQPRVGSLGLKSRFRHYLNLHKTVDRLERLLADFAWDRMDRVFHPGMETAEDKRHGH
jgi:polysaccharide deacetylase family protein (PEP-CTERM system associated)